MFSAYFQSADPTEVKTYVQSSAVLQMSADVLNGVCVVTYDSGNTYLYQRVSRRAILRFIYDSERSLGKFTNDVLKANNVTCTEVPSTVMLALQG